MQLRNSRGVIPKLALKVRLAASWQAGSRRRDGGSRSAFRAAAALRAAMARPLDIDRHDG